MSIDDKAVIDGYTDEVSEVMAYGQYRLAVRSYEAAKGDIGVPISEQPDEMPTSECQHRRALENIKYALNNSRADDEALQTIGNEVSWALSLEQSRKREVEQPVGKLWLWKNGEKEYWAFDSEYPRSANGDPAVLGEPAGYAIVKSATKRESVNFGALATHVASALGAMQGYGFQGVAAVKSLEHVQNVLMSLYERNRIEGGQS